MTRDFAGHPARLSLTSRLHGGPWGASAAASGLGPPAAAAASGLGPPAAAAPAGLGLPTATGKRVLEIGCRGGGALIALAFHDPEGTYRGLYQDAASVAAGEAAAAEIGLHNVLFKQGALEEQTGDLGVFEFVIAGDALARTEEGARWQLLERCRASLSETGILVLGYPVIPGAAHRGLVRALLAQHASGTAGGDSGAASDRGASGLRPPAAATASGSSAPAAAARASAEALRGMLGPSNHPYPQLLAMELTRFLEASDEVVVSDYLDAPEAVFAHRDVVKMAAEAGLRFVCDAMWNRPEGYVAPEIVEELAGRGLAGVDLDQALDVLRCRAERTSIFCRADVSPRERPGPQILDELWIASALVPASEAVNLAPGVEEPFSGEPGQRIASADPLLKAALVELHACSPRPLRFAEVVSAAVVRLHESGAEGEPSDAELAGVARDLWELHRRGLIDLLPEEPPIEGRTRSVGTPAPAGGLARRTKKARGGGSRWGTESRRSAPYEVGAPPQEETAPPTSDGRPDHSLNAMARYQVRTGAELTSPLLGKVPLDKLMTALLPHMVPGADEDALVRAMLVEASKGGVSIEIGGARLTDPELLEPMVRGLVRRAIRTLSLYGVLG